MRKAKIAIWAWTLLGVCAALGQAQTTGQSGKYCCEGYAFFGRRTSTPATNVGGVGGDIFIYKGLAVGGDAGTTVGNPDNRITIWSVGSSYHFLCCRAERKVEPFIGKCPRLTASGSRSRLSRWEASESISFTCRAILQPGWRIPAGRESA